MTEPDLTRKLFSHLCFFGICTETEDGKLSNTSPCQVPQPTCFLEVGWENKPLKNRDFNFESHFLSQIFLLAKAWYLNKPCMNLIFWQLRKNFFHTLGHSSPLSPFPQFGHLAPPIWPPLPDHIFIRISDEAVQSYFSSPISIEFMKYYGRQINKSKCTERWPNWGKGDRGL